MGAGTMVWAGLAPAQEGKRVPLVGFLATTNPAETPHYRAFLDGLAALGYHEGKNIRIQHRWSDGVKQQPELAAELVGLKPDLLVAWSSPSVAAAKQITSTLPIVMVAASDPVGSGFVASLARPGGNVTGMSNMHRGTITKNVEMLTRLVPGASHIAVMRNPENAAHRLVLQEAEAAAREYRLALQVLDVRKVSDIGPAFGAARKAQVAGLVIFGDPAFVGQRQYIADLARQAHLPSTTIFRQYPESGGLMSYGLNTTDLFYRAASFVDKILKGANPADLPVEQPTTFEMIINLKTAKAIGVEIPQDVLLRANRVIE